MFSEDRIYYLFQTGSGIDRCRYGIDRQKDILQFAVRQTNVGKRYSIRYQGMANRTKGIIQVGIGQEFACSEEGGGLIQELGFV